MAAKSKFQPRSLDGIIDSELLKEAQEANTNEDEPILVIEEESEKKAETIEIADVQFKEPPVQNVRVATNRDHSCVIGGTRYTFIKGKQQIVPIPVKDILLKAGLLTAI